MKLSTLYESSTKHYISKDVLQLFKDNSIDINKFIYLDIDKIKKPEHYNILNNIIKIFFEHEEFNFNEYYIDWTYNEILQNRIRSAVDIENIVNVLIDYDKNNNTYNDEICSLFVDLSPEAQKQRLKRLHIVDIESLNRAKKTKSLIYLINSEELINIYLEQTNQNTYDFSVSLYDKNIDIIHEDNKYYVYKINDVNTLKELSKRTRWCTKTDKYSNIYFNENTIYHIYDKNLQLPIIQFTGNKSEIKNRNNVNDHLWDEYVTIILKSISELETKPEPELNSKLIHIEDADVKNLRQIHNFIDFIHEMTTQSLDLDYDDFKYNHNFDNALHVGSNFIIFKRYMGLITDFIKKYNIPITIDNKHFKKINQIKIKDLINLRLNLIDILNMIK